jgi:hypothetical protein
MPSGQSAAESAVPSNDLSLEARAQLQKEQLFDLNEYIYDLNIRKQLARPKRTVNTYGPKQREFMVNFLHIFLR